MKQAQAFSGIVIGGTVSLLATQPVWAAATQVTGVQLNPSGGELQLILETKAGDKRPQIFTVHRGNDLVTDIVNTQLSLSKGDSFRQENPLPGVTSVVVSQLDAKRVRVTVTGAQSPPTGQILQSNPQGITLGISTAHNNLAAAPNLTSPSPTASANSTTPALPAQLAPKPTAQGASQFCKNIKEWEHLAPLCERSGLSDRTTNLQKQDAPPAQAPNPPKTVAQMPTSQPVQPATTPTAPASSATPTLLAQLAPKPPAQAPKPPKTVAQMPTSQPVQPATTPTAPTNGSIPTFQGQSSTTPIAQTQNPSTVTQTPTPQPIQPATTPTSPTQTGPTVVPQSPVPAPNPDVLIPNPKITIDGAPAPAAGAAQPVAPAPPFLPRAVAPPAGDIAISNINASASRIDLGTDVRVPRLVLREAPVREVLSLLARSAGLNVAFTDGGGGAGGAPQGGAPGGQQTISLDLENESVQDTFNYVLQISGLQANRVGRTILVGSRLPDNARNIVARTLRLNQARAVDAVGLLIAQGAEQQQITRQTTLTVVGEGAAAQRIENTTTTVQKIAPQVEQAQAQGGAAVATGPLTLRGLLVVPDERLNHVTLVGEPRQVEIATALLTQYDLRRRQVAVNVKVIDVNLTGTDAVNSSFSFGIGDAFFVNDNGAASFNYGGFRPPTSTQVQTSLVTPPVISNPFTGSASFIDVNRTINIPNGAFDADGNRINGTAFFPTGPFGLNGSPFSPGITNVTLGTPTIISGIGANRTVTPGTPTTVTTALPSLFQYPKKLLAALQAQIQSGNAKILTDPTLVVQEGQTATINLTQDVVTNVRRTTTITNGQPIVDVTFDKGSAGLILEINVQKIDDNGFISLTVVPSVSSIADQQIVDSGNGGSNTIVLLNNRQLSSGVIRLRDAQTLILSGIIQDREQTTVSKVPILGDIPLLGALFRSTRRTNQRQEVIVLLTPQIINDSEGSSFGYNYTPGREVRQILQQQGLPPQGNK